MGVHVTVDLGAGDIVWSEVQKHNDFEPRTVLHIGDADIFIDRPRLVAVIEHAQKALKDFDAATVEWEKRNETV